MVLFTFTTAHKVEGQKQATKECWSAGATSATDTVLTGEYGRSAGNRVNSSLGLHENTACSTSFYPFFIHLFIYFLTENDNSVRALQKRPAVDGIFENGK